MVSLNGSLCRKVAPFGYVCLTPRLSRALALFRLGVAPLNRNICFSSCISARICSFCFNSGAGKFIEDEFHACFECSLFDSLRCSLFEILHKNGFMFSSKQNCNDVCPITLLADLLSVANPAHVRCVSRFLNDCLSLRALYLEKCCMNKRGNHFKYWLLLDSDRQKFSKVLDDSLAAARRESYDFLKINSICLLRDLFSISLTPREPLWLLVNEAKV